MNFTFRLTKPENTGFYSLLADETVTLDLEEYLCGVVPSEVYEGRTPEEALKAQAIVARTYAVRKQLDNETIDDTSNYQSYSAPLSQKSPRSQKAVEDTKGQVLLYDGQVIQAYYGYSNDGETKRPEQVWKTALPYYENRQDPWDAAAREELLVKGTAVAPSYGVGMSQIGAEYAAGAGVTCEEILSFYYPGAVIGPYPQEQPVQATVGPDQRNEKMVVIVPEVDAQTAAAIFAAYPGAYVLEGYKQ